MGKKAVHFGAGNIGRGFVGELLHNSGYEVVFADVMDKLVKELHENKSYKVIQVDSKGDSESKVSNYRAINTRTNEDGIIEEIATADIVTCSVGPNALKSIAPVIAKGIDARPNGATPVAVIACENAIGATDILAEYIKNINNTPQHRLKDHHKRARFANSAIDRIVPAQEIDTGLDVKLEKFYEWIVERTPFRDHEPPAIKGIKWVDNLTPFIERKLFTVNTGHAAAAYWGYHLNKPTVHDALQDVKILKEVHLALEETSDLIIAKHGIDEQEQKKYVQEIIRRISNPHLEDTVERVGRAPLRKLSRRERFIGPASELAEKGRSCTSLLNAVEMAFRFQNVHGDKESFELAKIMKGKCSKDVVEHVCQLESEHPLFKRVQTIVEEVQRDMSRIM